jgi:hypothetical protein
MTTLKAELDALNEHIKALEAERATIYERSLAAPDEEKVCQDWIAESLSEVPNEMRFPITVHGIAWEGCGRKVRLAASSLRPSRDGGFDRRRTWGSTSARSEFMTRRAWIRYGRPHFASCGTRHSGFRRSSEWSPVRAGGARSQRGEIKRSPTSDIAVPYVQP